MPPNAKAGEKLPFTAERNVRMRNKVSAAWETWLLFVYKP